MDISLALGAGGAKGNSHIGVLRQLEKHGFRVSAIAGTSFGGVVGAVYAAGYSVDELEGLFARADQHHLYGRRPQDNASLYGLAGVEQWLIDALGDRTFADLKIPFAVAAIDLNSAQEVILSEGRVRDAILATIAIPTIFSPFRADGMELVDGGTFDPVPVSVARSLAPHLPVVAVVLADPLGEPARMPSIRLPIPQPIVQQLTHLRITQALSVFVRSLDVSDRLLTDLRLKIDKPDVIIRPEVADIGLLDVVDVHEVARRGEIAMDAVLPELKRITTWPNRLRRQLLGDGT
ncbi:MAG TPA: patatin-like phospholipase family protein [Anaerolineales bacterium]|nr:patatin-like phospholipase family protein [Anaerolineales bacterium]